MNPFLPAVIKGKSTFDTKKIATFCDHLLDAYIEKSPEEKKRSSQNERTLVVSRQKLSKQRRISDTNPQKPDHPGIPDGG